MPESVPISIEPPGGRSEAPAALELVGLTGLLRAWRAAAGEKRGLGRPLTQKEVARGIGRSVRWYIELEGGATPRLERSVLDALTRELMLGADQEASLHLYALGGAVTRAVPSLSAEKTALLQHLLDQQMPNPAYISDINWDIIGYNTAMAEWYPWVRKSGANLMRWALRSNEARQCYVNWEQHAIVYLEQLRYSLAEHPRNIQLQKLLEYVVEDPDCRRLWNANANVRRSGDGHHIFQALPRHDSEIVHVVSNVLYPASPPHSRLVVITWLREDDAEPESADSAIGRAPADCAVASVREKCQPPAVGAHFPADSPQQAASPAGDNAVALPTLSQLAGERCWIMLSPETRTVIWAEEQEGGKWSFKELDAYTVVAQLPPRPCAHRSARRV